MNLCNDRFF